jgi:class 3 adenylate cyclase
VASEPVERKLAAILSADVVGYSRLMAEDEDETVRRLGAYENAVENLARRAEVSRLLASRPWRGGVTLRPGKRGA